MTPVTNLNEWINGGRSYRFEVFFHIEMQFVASTAECIALQKFGTTSIGIRNGFVYQHPIAID